MRLVLFVLISLISYHSSNALAEPTVTDGQYLNSKFSLSAPKGFDDLKRHFTDFPLYATDCVIDDTVQAPQDSKAGAVFQHITQIPFNGALSFEVRNGKYGFDLLVERTPLSAELKNTTPYAYKEKVACTVGESGADCTQIAFSKEQSLKPTEIDGEMSDDGVTMVESWLMVFGSENELLAKASVELRTTQRNWLGAPTGQITLTQNYICQLRLLESLRLLEQGR